MANIARRLANLNWFAVVLYPATVVLMEIFWVHSWLAWAGEWPLLDWEQSPLGLVSLIFLTGLSFLVARAFTSQRRLARWVPLGIVLAAILLVVRIEYGAGYGWLSGQWFADTARLVFDSFPQPEPIGVALVAAIYLCWRGLRLGRSRLYFEDVYRSFLVGLAGLVLLVIVWRASLGEGSLEGLASTAGLDAVGFFFFGLFALSLGNLRAIQRRMAGEEAAPVSIRRWIPVQLAVVGGIVAVGIGVASIFSPEFVAMLGRLLSMAKDVFYQVLYYLLIPFDYLARGLVWIWEAIIRFVQMLRGCEQAEASGGTPALFEDLQPVVSSHLALPILKWVFFIIAIAAALFLLVRALSRYRAARAESEVEEVHESLWSWAGLKADLRLFFSLFWRHFRLRRPGRKAARGRPAPVRQLLGDTGDILDIREIYRHLLREAAGCGLARRSHETPDEYAGRLVRAVPDSSQELRQLTDLYLDTRYGELEAGEKKVALANSLWRALRDLLRGPAREYQPG